ncbi:MAG: Orotidine 5'-phosphate decarboxylase [Phycisphaerae bacterium]|nr:Orotidine 5'-phosphate decarboxylase [Phycisphaerae bacterium]
MSVHFTDRLLRAIADKSAPICVGLDPVYEKLPPSLVAAARQQCASEHEAEIMAILEFCRRIIAIIAPIAPAIKINTAYFERYYGAGIDGYFELVKEAVRHQLIVIGDCKRGDVGHTAEQYASAQLADRDFDKGGRWVAPDAVTLHTYLGLDGLLPFLQVARTQGKGIFALIQTSNPSAGEIQNFTNAAGITLAEHVAQLLDRWASAEGLIGVSGYSALGAVVAPKQPELTRRLRELMPRSIFLVPGYGAQGATADDVRPCFNADGRGALITASRSVIFAHASPRYQARHGDQWEKCVESACRDFAGEVQKIL